MKKVETLAINEDDMMTIVALSKAIIDYSKNKTIASLLGELELIELVAKDKDKLLWHEPTLKCVKAVHKKFSGRIKQLKKEGKI